jgi:large subunit ribosomal protein L15
MMIHEITEKVGRHKARKRIGRGEGSGHGKTAGRGHKGAASRAGYSRRPSYEGGQLPWFQRFPKRGFSNAAFTKRYHVINLKMLEERFEDGAEITLEVLAAQRLVRDVNLPLKVLGEGDLTKKFSVTATKFSASARKKIEDAGGTTAEPASKSKSAKD